MTTTTTTASYRVYAVVGGDHPGPRRHTLPVIRAAGLAAVVADAAEQPDRLRAALEDHLEVLDDLAEGGPVLPLSFGLVAASPESVEADLEGNAARYRQLLELVTGRRQFDVRARYDEATVLRAIVGSDPRLRRMAARAGGPAPAAAMRERIELGERVAEAMTQRRRADAGRFGQRLGAVAGAVREQPPRQGVDVHLSCLVDDDRRAEFTDVVDQLAVEAGRTMTVSCTGPAPAFSFMDGP